MLQISIIRNELLRLSAARRTGQAAALLLVLAALSHPALAQRSSPTPPPKESEPEEIVRVETRLVTVPVTIRRGDGAYIDDLRREDFRVFEDGVEQQVAHFERGGEPISVVLLMDYSHSVRSDLPSAREAAAAFLGYLRPEDRVRAVAFGTDIQVLLGGVTGDRGSLRESILKTPMMGATALYDAVFFTLKRVVEPSQGRKAVVLFTDGADTYSHVGSYEQGLSYAEQLDAPVHVVMIGGVVPGSGPDNQRQGLIYLQKLARKSGGRVHLGGSRGGMTKLLSKVADELRAQYNVGYYPSAAPRPGKRRQLKVSVTRSGAKVRAKQSYIERKEETPPR